MVIVLLKYNICPGNNSELACDLIYCYHQKTLQNVRELLRGHPANDAIHHADAKPRYIAPNHNATIAKLEQLLDDFRKITFWVFRPSTSDPIAIKSMNLSFI